jgi:hypothetical protein
VCKAISLRFQSAVHLVLCAEAGARHGQLDDAQALVARQILQDAQARSH